MSHEREIVQKEAVTRIIVELSNYLQFVQITLKNMLGIIGNSLSLTYFVFDGAFGRFATNG